MYPLPKDEAEKFFAELYYGKHHIPSELKQFGAGWCINDVHDFSTTDFNAMTRFVLMCHRDCIRGSVMSSGPRMIKIAIWKRSREEKGTETGHPTLAEAVERFNNYNSKSGYETIQL